MSEQLKHSGRAHFKGCETIHADCARSNLARKVLALLKDKWILIPDKNSVRRSSEKRKADIKKYQAFNMAFREVERDIAGLFIREGITLGDEHEQAE